MRLRSTIVSALILAAGCAGTNPAPPEWTVSNDKAATWTYGHWAVVTTANGAHFSGELIAIGEASSLTPEYVYIGRGGIVDMVRIEDVRQIRVLASKPESHSGWLALGTLSTVTHGLFGIFTIPVWALTGIPVSLDSRLRVLVTRRLDERVRVYARFPQGLPPAVRGRLRIHRH